MSNIVILRNHHLLHNCCLCSLVSADVRMSIGLNTYLFLTTILAKLTAVFINQQQWCVRQLMPQLPLN